MTRHFTMAVQGGLLRIQGNDGASGTPTAGHIGEATESGRGLGDYLSAPTSGMLDGTPYQHLEKAELPDFLSLWEDWHHQALARLPHRISSAERGAELCHVTTGVCAPWGNWWVQGGVRVSSCAARSGWVVVR